MPPAPWWRPARRARSRPSTSSRAATATGPPRRPKNERTQGFPSRRHRRRGHSGLCHALAQRIHLDGSRHPSRLAQSLVMRCVREAEKSALVKIRDGPRQPGESDSAHRRCALTLQQRRARPIDDDRKRSWAKRSIADNNQGSRLKMRRIACVGDRLERGGSILPYAGPSCTCSDAGHQVALIGGHA